MKSKTHIYLSAFGKEFPFYLTVKTQEQADTKARELLAGEYVKVTALICNGSTETRKQMTRKKLYWH